MGTQRVQKLEGREKTRRYKRPNRAFVIAQQMREESERQVKIRRVEHESE